MVTEKTKSGVDCIAVWKLSFSFVGLGCIKI